MKILPGLTHAVTKESFPNRDCSCFLVKKVAACQVVSSASKCLSRVVGTSRVNVAVSTRMPRQIVEVEGSESFSGEESRPS